MIKILSPDKVKSQHHLTSMLLWDKETFQGVCIWFPPSDGLTKADLKRVNENLS